MLIRSAFAFLLCCSPLYANAATTLVVTVTDQNGQAVSGAQVILVTNPVEHATSDARGNARLAYPQAGTYSLHVSATGYRSVSQTLRISNQKAINVTLEPSAGALHVIGSVTGHARSPFNATPVAQRVYPREAYRDQGQPDVTSVMNQTPGALALTSTTTNTATPLSPAFASVRNGLPFETPVLLDGEPILTPSGTLDLSLLPTYVLQEVEIVKGSGDVANSGGGVGGAVNFRTAEPTLGQRGTFETEGDSQGGSFTDLAYDGTEPGGVLAYATMLSVDGSPCCTPDPSDYTRKAVLIKLRETPATGVSITETVLNVVLNRSLDSIYGLPGFGYEHLTFADVAASLDRGSDAFSLRTFVAQTQTGIVSPNVLPQPIDDEVGATLGWQHTSGKLAFDTSARVVSESLPSFSGAYQTQSTASESITYKPDARNELDLSGALNGYNSNGGVVRGPSARFAYAYTVRSGLALRASYGTSAVAPPLEAIAPLISEPFPTTSSVTSVERATGADVGLEWRLHGNSTTFSADLYRNNTQDVYGYGLGNWYNGPPMVESGIEFSLQQFKRVGMGFIAALQLPRTYVWGATTLPYSDANLGYGAIAPFRIPYAQGYAEISYKWPRGSRASIGALYVGSNNAYGAPAFATLNSNLELSLGARAKLQFSAENLTNQLANRPPIYGPMPQYGLVPFTLRFMFRQSFGTGALYEH